MAIYAARSFRSAQWCNADEVGDNTGGACCCVGADGVSRGDVCIGGVSCGDVYACCIYVSGVYEKDANV